jgi:hypothetical protein
LPFLLPDRTETLLDKPEDAQAWMGNKIWKPQVKKVGVEKLEEV